MARSIDERQGFPGFLTNGLVGISESIMSFVEKSVDDLPSFPRLDAQECVKRCICEAHNQPKKYGVVGLMLQLFFPPYTETDEPSRIVSKYQLAARYGRQDNANCAAQYDGCMVNFLDLIQGIINLIF
ncbi:DM4/DM12 domain containing protein-like protein [Leptotrombidium deliense]|uniref:DM4/DM12 domain containing protein-like protein n=1 Tax=Leptotrombidium deliense TaxID=299467 RepID=A0A443SDR1_9ACAR|nr:DM4/DM12 domain containing protein-like protein [Leptotrombidium deliense]